MTKAIETLVLEAARVVTARMHTCLPAVVVSYDRTTQKATVQPVLRGRRKAGDGTVTDYRGPAVPNVPVAFPSAADTSITWDLTAGDPVTLVVAERSTDEWRATGEEDITPASLRRFDLSDAIAIPGGRPFSEPVPSSGYASGVLVVRAPEVRLGSSAAAKWVALADDVLARLNALETTFNLHTHQYLPGPGTAVATGPAGTAGTTVLADIAATKVKAE